MISFLILLFLNFNELHALEPSQLNPNCKNQGWVNNLLMHLGKSEIHPFEDICMPIDYENEVVLSAKSNAEAMNFNVYMTQLPEKTPGGASVREFFEDIKRNIKRKIEQERQKVLNALKCLETKTPNDCLPVPGNVLDFLEIDAEARSDYKFSNLVSDARYNLILSTRPPNFLGNMRDRPAVLNHSLNDLGSYKRTSWSSASNSELEDARRALNSYYVTAQEMLYPDFERLNDWRNSFNQKQTELNRNPHPEEQEKLNVEKERLVAELTKMRAFYNPRNRRHNSQVQSTVNAFRQLHFGTYIGIMGMTPPLQFIKSSNPSKEEVKGALNQTLAAMAEEEKEIEKITSGINSSLNTDLLRLMVYKTEVGEALASKNKYCGLARDLEQLRIAKDIGFQMGVSLPILAASLAAPFVSLPFRSAAIALTGAANIGGSIAIAHRTQQKIDLSSYQVVARFNEDKGQEILRQKFDELSEMSSDRDLEYFMAAAGTTQIGMGYTLMKVFNPSWLSKAARSLKKGSLPRGVFTRDSLRGADSSNP
jgi:hypothetical protein